MSVVLLSELACVWYCYEPSAFIHSDNWKRSLPWPKNWIAMLIAPVMAMLDHRFCRRFMRVLVNSEFSRDATVRVYGYDCQNCRTAYLGVDHERFRPIESRERRPWVTVVAKLTRFKNVDVIIRAVAELVRRGQRDVHLNIVGTGDALLHCQHTAQAENVVGNVTFHGRLPDESVVKLLQQSRVFCLASADEPFGLVVVEALACGTPVVAMDSGGPREILNNLTCGRLCKSLDANQIADALAHFLTMSDESFRSVSEYATQRAKEFSWDNASLQIEAELMNSVSTKRADCANVETG